MPNRPLQAYPDRVSVALSCFEEFTTPGGSVDPSRQKWSEAQRFQTEAYDHDIESWSALHLGVLPNAGQRAVRSEQMQQRSGVYSITSAACARMGAEGKIICVHIRREPEI
jgi:hypothetical protein